MAGVTYLRSGPRRMISMHLNSPWEACAAVMDDTLSWQDRLGQVTAAMVALPEDTDLAFVQYSSAYSISWGRRPRRAASSCAPTRPPTS
jgi:hypothetical protein